MDQDFDRPSRRRNDPADASRLPPHAPEAERGVLGCILIQASDSTVEHRGEAMDECLRRHLSWQHFYDLRHQVIWKTILELNAEGKPADMVLLVGSLRAASQLEAVGGVDYLGEMQDGVPSAANLSMYLDVLTEKFALRRMLKLCTETVSELWSHDGDVKGFVGQFESQALELSEAHVPTEARPITEFLPEFIDAIETRNRGKQDITGLATPFWYLNNMTAGLQPGQLIVIGARPGTGKTAIGTDLARHVLALGHAVLFVSLEMSGQEIVGRATAAEAKVDGLKLRNGFWRDDKYADITNAVGRMAAWKGFLIDDRTVCTGQDVYIGIRRAIRTHNIALCVVDYVQLLTPTREYGSRALEVAEASAWLRRAAKDFQIPVVGLAQLNRESEKDRPGKPPILADLRECGNLEQDAHLVGFLYEPRLEAEAYDDMKWMAHHVPDDPKEDGEWNLGGSATLHGSSGKTVEVRRGWKEEFRRINLLIAKNRNGPTGACELVFQKRSARFVDAHSPQRTKAEKGQLI